jgi:predicted TIM-barrel fold metal-dependent hydrolase
MVRHPPFDAPRRDFLGFAAVAAAGFAVRRPALAAEDALEPQTDLEAGFIDAHSHIWTPDIEKYPLAGGQTAADLKPASFTADELLTLARPLGVTRVVLIQHKPYHGLDNSYLADTIAKYAGRLSGVACIDAEAAEPERDMAQLKAQGFRGFRIRPGEGGTEKWRDSAGMRRMWDFAAQARLAICPLIDPGDLPQVDEMCTRFPRTTVVIDHFARIGIDGTMRDADLKVLVDLARHERIRVKISAYYALGKKSPPYEDLIPMIRRLHQAYGPHRLMWGSDSPYQLAAPNSYAESLGLVRERVNFWSDADRDAVLRKTAAEVYFS